MAWKHIHLSPEAERGDEKEGRRKEGSGEGKNKKKKCAAIHSTKETEPVRGRCDKKCKELTSQLAAG